MLMQERKFKNSPIFTESCPTEDGFVFLADENICFKAFKQLNTWYEARDNCSQLGSRLIVLDTNDKNEAVGDYLRINVGKYSLNVQWTFVT